MDAQDLDFGADFGPGTTLGSLCMACEQITLSIEMRLAFAELTNLRERRLPHSSAANPETRRFSANKSIREKWKGARRSPPEFRVKETSHRGRTMKNSHAISTSCGIPCGRAILSGSHDANHRWKYEILNRSFYKTWIIERILNFIIPFCLLKMRPMRWHSASPSILSISCHYRDAHAQKWNGNETKNVNFSGRDRSGVFSRSCSTLIVC